MSSLIEILIRLASVVSLQKKQPTLMKELQDIVKAFDQSITDKKQSALLTVVHVEGSSYRRPGARMLVTEDGILTGAISGGCLEGDALRKALLVMNQQRSMLVTYDTTDEDDVKLGTGLGCNGIIQILIEPVDANNPLNPVEIIRKVISKRRSTILVTLFSLINKKQAQPGTCLLLEEDGTIVETLQTTQPVYTPILTDARSALQNQRTVFKTYTDDSDELTAFIEYRQPQISLIIIGAGNDARPLAAMADIIGWQVTVIDGRPNYTGKDRFPQACTIRISKPDNALNDIAIDQRTACLLMTHNYQYDKMMLHQLIQYPAGYIGMLGPKKKYESMMSELTEEGLTIKGGQASIIHSPIGLDLGAETAEEIALSILSEIQMVFTGSTGKSLHNQTSVIHSRKDTIIEKQMIPTKA